MTKRDILESLNNKEITVDEALEKLKTKTKFINVEITTYEDDEMAKIKAHFPVAIAKIAFSKNISYGNIVLSEHFDINEILKIIENGEVDEVFEVENDDVKIKVSVE